MFFGISKRYRRGRTEEKTEDYKGKIEGKKKKKRGEGMISDVNQVSLLGYKNVKVNKLS